MWNQEKALVGAFSVITNLRIELFGALLSPLCPVPPCNVWCLQLSSDDIITVLTTYIILFSDDFCSLMDRRRVEQTQVRHASHISRWIKNIYIWLFVMCRSGLSGCCSATSTACSRAASPGSSWPTPSTWSPASGRWRTSRRWGKSMSTLKSHN